MRVDVALKFNLKLFYATQQVVRRRTNQIEALYKLSPDGFVERAMTFSESTRLLELLLELISILQRAEEVLLEVSHFAVSLKHFLAVLRNYLFLQIYCLHQLTA